MSPNLLPLSSPGYANIYVFKEYAQTTLRFEKEDDDDMNKHIKVCIHQPAV